MGVFSRSSFFWGGSKLDCRGKPRPLPQTGVNSRIIGLFWLKHLSKLLQKGMRIPNFMRICQKLQLLQSVHTFAYV